MSQVPLKISYLSQQSDPCIVFKVSVSEGVLGYWVSASLMMADCRSATLSRMPVISIS